MKKPQRKSRAITSIAAVCMIVVLAMIFPGCSGSAQDDTTTENTVVSGTENPTDSLEKVRINPSDYVELGNYEGFEVSVDGLDVYVGEVLVDLPYHDEGYGTEKTLQYYYSQVNPTEDRTNWVIPADEEVARMGIPGITSFSELKDYVLQKINENDDITSFMIIGDAAMEQVVGNSTFKAIPEDVILACEGIYADYLAEMLARYNEIGEIPVVQQGDNSAYKVLAAMAIAKETGIDMDSFDYEQVLKQLVE